MARNEIWDEQDAALYDDSESEMFDPSVLAATVDFLVEVAGGGRALEFAVGTGRVTLPLSERGVSVAGIELSQPMVDQMMSKPGADRIPVTIGDMATTRVDGTFSLVYLVFNTITNLLTQEEQVQCFRNAATHLDVGGHFVIEVFVPQLQRLPIGDVYVPFEVSDHHVGVDEYDVVSQRLISHHFFLADGRGEAVDSHHRYAWPAEYDLMARIAGLELVERWADWHRNPFTAESASHVSVWRKSAASPMA